MLSQMLWSVIAGYREGEEQLCPRGLGRAAERRVYESGLRAAVERDIARVHFRMKRGVCDVEVLVEEVPAPQSEALKHLRIRMGCVEREDGADVLGACFPVEIILEDLPNRQALPTLP
jgi:hypothetical protein